MSYALYGLNENGPIGSQGVALLGVALWKEVCHWGWGVSRFQMLKPGLVGLSLTAACRSTGLSEWHHADMCVA